MAHTTVKFLITGFGPFPGVRSNPSGQLVDWIERGQYHAPAGTRVCATVVPTSWRAVRDFVTDEMAVTDADVLIHFGVSKRARGFQVEQFARNAASTSADCEGRLFDKPCLAGDGPPVLRSPIVAEPLVRKLQSRGLPATTSADAGRYLCNMLLYLSLKQAREGTGPRYRGFVHIPPLTPGHFCRSELMAGLGTIVTHCAGLHRRAAAHHASVTG